MPRRLPLQPLMSTLILGGQTADQYCERRSEIDVQMGVQWVPAENMPPRRRVSIEEFERDMVAAGVRKPKT